jgi:hypothetical protein
MSSGTAPYLFGARSTEEQAEREGAVNLILSSLEQVSRSEAPVSVGLTSEGVELITWLMDLGAAPNRFQVSETLRLISTGRPAVMLLIAPNIAGEMRSLVERGAFRHRAGARDPSTIRIH